MIQFSDKHFGIYTLSTDKTKIQQEVIHHFLAEESYWAKGISRETLSTSIQHSLCLGVYLPDGSQVAFGRIITDYARFGYLADVFVLREHRGKGISKEMMQYFCAMADQYGFRRFLLITQDAQALYKQFGFDIFPHPESMMSRAGVTSI